MGFYHPGTIVKDQTQHGVRVLHVDVVHSAWQCTLEEPTRNANSEQRKAKSERRTAKSLSLGLRFVRGLREEAGERIVAERGGRRSRRSRTSCGAIRSSGIDTLAELARSLSPPPQAIWQVARLGRGDGPLCDGDEERRTPYDVRRTPLLPAPPHVADRPRPLGLRGRRNDDGAHRSRSPAGPAAPGASRARSASLPDGRWVKVGGRRGSAPTAKGSSS